MMSTKSAMWIDGSTYIGLAMVTAMGAAMGSDEAAKWVSPQTLFWARTSCTVVGAGLLGLKMYRSTGYAQHVKEVEDTKFFKKSESSEL